MAEVKQSVLEDYGGKPVPLEKGKSWIGISTVYWGASICLPAFLIAGLVAGPMRLGTAILAFIVGGIVLGVISILTGIIGTKTRLSTGLTASFTFGTYGANILQLILFFAFWGWFGVQLGFMVAGLGNGGLIGVFGTGIPAWVLMVAGGALMTVTTMFGFKAIEKLSLVAIPLLLIIIIATIAGEFGHGKDFAASMSASSDKALPLGVAISIIISTYIIGALCAPDMTRYAKSRAHGGWGMAVGILVGFPVVLTLGAIMVKGSNGEVDFSKVMMANHTGFWALIAVLAIILAAWTTNDTNLYSGTLSVNAMFPKLKNWVITLVSGVIGTLLAILGINTAGGFQTFLGFIAVLVPPAAAIIGIDFYLFRSEANRAFDSARIAEVEKIRWQPFLAWVLGSAFGFVTQYSAFKLTHITALDAMIVSALVYVITMLASRERFRPAF